jgi:predicted RNA-binding Zn-ribbon protein involved in translation (DUF1610 family)
MIKDILELLKALPEWNRLTKLPAEVEALRRRVEMLEASRNQRTPLADECPKCRSLTYRLDREEPEPSPFGNMGARQRVYRCNNCGFESVEKMM